MKIAAVGNESSRNAMAAKKFAPGVKWVWVDTVDALGQHRDAVLYADFNFTPDKARIGQLSQLLPRPVLVHSVIHTLAEIGQPFIRINGWPGLLERAPCELAVGHRSAGAGIGETGIGEKGIEETGMGEKGMDETEVKMLFDSLGWPCRIVPDIPGMISGRILATIINEAYFTLQDEVSTKEEIDEAMRLGTGYPFGPFEWGQRIGLASVFSLLGALSRENSRYMPAKALKEELSDVKI